MIALHILKLLEDEGFGTIDTDLFFDEAPLDSTGKPKQGMWIVERGAGVDRFTHRTQNFDLYSRYTNKLTGYKKLESILEYLQEAYGEVCTLPPVPPHSSTVYNDVRLEPSSSVENAGVDDNGKIVRVISGVVRYNK